MSLLRSALWYLVTVITVLIWTPLVYISYPLGYRVVLGTARSWAWMTLWVTRWVCGIRYEIIGAENLKTTPAIFFVKHQSAWETLGFPALLPMNCFVCKKSLLNIPFFGWAMRITKHIPIDRSQGVSALKSVIREGKDRLGKGISIVIFPEGTRVEPYTHPKFHKSGSALAKATGYPVIPIALNSGHCWRRNSFLKRPGTVTVVIGPPMNTRDKTVDEINDSTYAWMKHAMEKMEGENHDRSQNFCGHF